MTKLKTLGMCALSVLVGIVIADMRQSPLAGQVKDPAAKKWETQKIDFASRGYKQWEDQGWEPFAVITYPDGGIDSIMVFGKRQK